MWTARIVDGRCETEDEVSPYITAVFYAVIPFLLLTIFNSLIIYTTMKVKSEIGGERTNPRADNNASDNSQRETAVKIEEARLTSSYTRNKSLAGLSLPAEQKYYQPTDLL